MMNEAREDSSQKIKIGRADGNFGDVCSQTGEEFSVEFLRDRMGVRRIHVMPKADHFLPESPRFNFLKDQHVVYEEASGPLRHTGGKSYANADFANVMAKPMPSPYMESPTHLDYTAWPQGEYDFLGQRSNVYYDDAAHARGAMDPAYSSGSPQSYFHQGGPGIITQSSSHFKMKLLCSYGGRIFPRPSDGKLRYVGGETRIISIRKNLSWEELMKKTSAICNQPHTIKYQLPGEDLDALISVCSDEDLQNMIEEYHELEKVGTCQRLRIFLVPLTEIESPNSFEARLSAEQQAVDYQYVIAVNGILDRSPQKSAKGQIPASQVMHQGTTSSDNSPSCLRDSPTFLQPLEIHDYSPKYSNLARTSSNPSAQLLTVRQISNNLHDLSPRATQVPPQKKDLTNHSHVNESNRHFVLDKHPSDKSYYHDNANHQNPTSTQPLQLIDSQIPNFFEAEHIYRQRGTHVPDQNIAEDFVPASCYGLFDINFSRPILKARVFHSDKLATRPEDPASQLLESPELDDPHYGLMHVLSDSQLEGLYRGSTHSTEEGTISCSLSFSTEKVPLLATSSHSSREWKMKSQDLTAAKYQESTSGSHSNEEARMIRDQTVLEWQDDKDSNSFQEKKQFRVIVDEDCTNMLQEHKASSNIELKVSSESQKYSLAPHEDAKRMGCIESAFKDQHGQNPVRTHGSPNQVPELVVSSVSPNHSCKERKSHEEGLLDGAGEVSSEARFNKGLKPVNVMPPRKENHRNIVQPISVIVEDVTENMPLDIPISSSSVAHIQDDPGDSISSARETEGESIAADTDYEDVKSDGHDADDPISDAVIAEIEAGIYGLQIIKNTDLEELQELGSGTFGTVYHGKWRGTDVAIKRIKNSCFAGRSSEQDRITKDFWREAKILSNLHHPNVVAFYGVVPDGPGGTLATVTEFMVNGSLRHNLVRNNRALDRRKKLMIAMDAAFGMEYLHFKNIVHFDLKCDNLLVNLKDPRRPICKVADFGLSRIKQNTFVSGGIRGTLPWMAPELLNGTNNRVSEKVDIFSFGIAMWEMVTREEPYANMHCGAIIGGIVSNTLRPPIPEGCDPEWRELMEECWSADPSRRPSFTQITMRLQTMLKTLQTKRYAEKPKY